MTRIIAHRGASRVAPENTLAAFRAAARLGADGVELDVHASRDGALVVIHDHDVSRTTGGVGEVWMLEADALRRLDAGRWFAAEFVGERVPWLDEVLALENLSFEIQLCGLTRGFVASVAEAIDRRDRWRVVEITSEHVPLLVEMKRIRPQARVGFFAPPKPDWMSPGLRLEALKSHAELLGAEVVHVPSTEVDGPWSTRFGRAGYASRRRTPTRPATCGARSVAAWISSRPPTSRPRWRCARRLARARRERPPI